jgi:hypothetical protein
MSHYYFHTSGARPLQDTVEVELPDDDKAREMAARMLGELLQEYSRTFLSAAEITLEVETEGHTILRLRASAEPAPCARHA